MSGFLTTQLGFTELNAYYLALSQSIRTGIGLDYYRHADAEQILNDEPPRVKNEVQTVVRVQLVRPELVN